MRLRVLSWLDAGVDVRIFTARVAPASTPGRMVDAQRQYGFIMDWCAEHLGRPLPITCQKDMAMIELWDDRAVQVEKNTGVVIGFSTQQETFHV
jgi:hypothetical protein